MNDPLPLIILRPEPGASETAARAAASGLVVHKLPLFAAGPVDWTVPDPALFDGLLLTSANAPRFAGTGLGALQSLPAWCVGPASAEAAESAGLTVRHVGGDGAQSVVEAAAAAGARHLLWLAGEDRTPLMPPEPLSLTIVPVYHARPLPVAADALPAEAVVLIHSKRAARRLATLATDRSRLHMVAISHAVADAAGRGWASCHTVGSPDDGEMVAIAAKLCHEAAKRPETE